MTQNYWAELHEIYGERDWATKPSIFAETVVAYLPENGKLLELGAGLGQDSKYFSELGYDVTATDLETDSLVNSSNGKFFVQKVDINEQLPFDNHSFDIVYAHLSLHYFDEKTTEKIFTEIHRILKPGGILAFLTNSTDDPEYDTGTKVEINYFEVDGISKRYLDVESAKSFAHEFKPLIADNNGETYKDAAVGVHNLIRFVGLKIPHD